MARDDEPIQMQNLDITETQLAIQTVVMWQPNCKECLHLDATMNKFIQKELFSPIIHAFKHSNI